MARGITEYDVHKAANAVVADGERPTVERIRAYMGTGSPNTIIKWLDTWWQKLGERLLAEQAGRAIPDAPAAVTALAGEWWALAIKHATTVADEMLAADRASLEAEQDVCRQDRARFEAESVTFREQLRASLDAERLASVQVDELKRLSEHLSRQIQEISGQRDLALDRAAEAEVARLDTEKHSRELQDAGRRERESLALHIRAVEDRAHAEIDRAREEVKELKKHLTAAAKEHAAIQKSFHRDLEQAKAATSKAIREAVVERARADALEKQLAKFQHLPAALEAAMRKSNPPVKKVRSTEKKVSKGAKQV